MARCMLAESGFPSCVRGELFEAAAYLKNRTPHKALKMETPFKMLDGEKADLSHLYVIGVRTFARIKDSRNLDAAAWEGKVGGYSEEDKSYRVWNPKTHRVVERRDVTFIETPPYLLPPTAKLSPLQDLVLPSCDLDDDTLDNGYISCDVLLRDVRDYTGVLAFTANIPANNDNVSGVSADLKVQALVDQIHDLTRRDLLTPAAPLPEATSPAEPLPGAVREPLSGGTSPEVGRLSSAPTPPSVRRGTAMCNNRNRRPNVVT